MKSPRSDRRAQGSIQPAGVWNSCRARASSAGGQRTGPEEHVGLSGVVQEDFTVGRQATTRQRRHVAMPRGQLGQREFDVLAGTQVVGGEVWAGAQVVAAGRAADGHAIVPAAVGVADAEFGKHRRLFLAPFCMPQVLQLEALLAPELAAQRALPYFSQISAGLR